MAAAYGDNFGSWEIDGPDERAFFEHVREQSRDDLPPLRPRGPAYAAENGLRLLRLSD